jgi:hypothetical protein
MSYFIFVTQATIFYSVLFYFLTYSNLLWWDSLVLDFLSLKKLIIDDYYDGGGFKEGNKKDIFNSKQKSWIWSNDLLRFGLTGFEQIASPNRSSNLLCVWQILYSA